MVAVSHIAGQAFSMIGRFVDAAQHSLLFLPLAVFALICSKLSPCTVQSLFGVCSESLEAPSELVVEPSRHSVRSEVLGFVSCGDAWPVFQRSPNSMHALTGASRIHVFAPARAIPAGLALSRLPEKIAVRFCVFWDLRRESPQRPALTFLIDFLGVFAALSFLILSAFSASQSLTLTHPFTL